MSLAETDSPARNGEPDKGGRRRFGSLSRAGRTVAILALGTVVVRAAWLADDAYITLRTVDNFWNGFGLRWNVMERVQAYTHPLWMMLMAAAYGVTREAYFTTLALSALCLMVTVALLVGRLSALQSTVAITMFVVSRAFVDYSSSGLENPLSHVFLTAFCLASLNNDRPSTRFRRLAWIATCCALTRLDLALLVAPSMLWETRQIGIRRALPELILAALPLACWHGFTLLYYGSLVPNTALAKLNTGVPRLELIEQGVRYLIESFHADFITLPVTLIAVGIGVWHGRLVRWLCAGIALSILYVMAVGGDVMSGRFLTPSFVVSAIVVSSGLRRSTTTLAAITALLIVGFVSPRSPLHVWIPEDSQPWSVAIADPETHGIVDERRVYYWATGFLRIARGQVRVTNHPRAQTGLVWGGSARVHIKDAIGMVSYYAGPAAYIVDKMALADPFLARLKLSQEQPWLIGHFERKLPNGYEESLTDCLAQLYPSGRFTKQFRSCVDVGPAANHVAAPALHKLYADVTLVTQGSLFSIERWRAIVRLNGWARH